MRTIKGEKMITVLEAFILLGIKQHYSAMRACMIDSCYALTHGSVSTKYIDIEGVTLTMKSYEEDTLLEIVGIFKMGVIANV